MKLHASMRLRAAALTNRTVEKAIKQKFGMDVRLYKGNGYYYFADPDDQEEIVVGHWPESSVYVYRLNQMRLDQWLAEFERLMEQGKR